MSAKLAICISAIVCILASVTGLHAQDRKAPPAPGTTIETIKAEARWFRTSCAKEHFDMDCICMYNNFISLRDEKGPDLRGREIFDEIAYGKSANCVSESLARKSAEQLCPNVSGVVNASNTISEDLFCKCAIEETISVVLKSGDTRGVAKVMSPMGIACMNPKVHSKYE